MKTPHASLAEARRRHSGLLFFSRCLAAAASLVCAAPAAPAATPAPSVPHTHADTPGGSESPEVTAARKKVADLELQLRQLQNQLATLKAQEPADPGSNASAEAQKKYHQAMAKWQAQVDKVQHQIASATQQLALAKKKLQTLLSGRSGTAS